MPFLTAGLHDMHALPHTSDHDSLVWAVSEWSLGCFALKGALSRGLSFLIDTLLGVVLLTRHACVARFHLNPDLL
jgi:hypothetical protein